MKGTLHSIPSPRTSALGLCIFGRNRNRGVPYRLLRRLLLQRHHCLVAVLFLLLLPPHVAMDDVRQRLQHTGVRGRQRVACYTSQQQ